MPNILLLGAGFSRNWGGVLADEVFNQLIGAKEIRNDDYLRTLLWNNKENGGFENALAELQIEFLKDPGSYTVRLRCLQNTVLNTFNNMNQAFIGLPDMEFQNISRERMLRTFLFQFDAIFTLNQDIFLEHHYLHHLGLSGRWQGPQIPGMRRIENREVILGASWGRDTWVPLDPAQFMIQNRTQPLFKLHGSTNWKNTEGGELLVLGGNKSHAIQSHTILNWYFDKFQEYLSSPNTKLFVIGYGFKDQHINQVIIEAVHKYELQFVVVDQNGADVVKRANPSYGGQIYAPNALDDAFREGLIGASNRHLSEIFGNAPSSPASHRLLIGYF